jgi:hypothetical protein
LFVAQLLHPDESLMYNRHGFLASSSPSSLTLSFFLFSFFLPQICNRYTTTAAAEKVLEFLAVGFKLLSFKSSMARVKYKLPFCLLVLLSSQNCYCCCCCLSPSFFTQMKV